MDNINVKNAKAILGYLKKCGVDHFCCSPGSRSTPFVLALQEKAFIHFDERGMAFHALGIAKATQKPVCLFVTSGTAVANLFPAIMEASVSRIPLIVLTADRPQDKLFCGENQTADQSKIFSTYVRFQYDLSCSDPGIEEEYIAGLMSLAVNCSMRSPKGPVHINCQFREPLFSNEVAKEPTKIPTHYEISEMTPKKTTLERWGKIFSSHKKGIIVAGVIPHIHDRAPLFELAQKLGWPIFADVLSNCRENCIAYHNHILKQCEKIKPDCILHLGDRLTNKMQMEWLYPNNARNSDLSAPKPRDSTIAKGSVLTNTDPFAIVESRELSHSSDPNSWRCLGMKAPYYFLVADHPHRHDPKNVVTHRLEYDPIAFCEAVLPFVQETEGWLSFWKEKESFITEQLENHFNKNEKLTEPSIFWELAKEANYPLCLPNSMPVRDADFFFFPKQKFFPVFSNRGVSGSDGNIATAAGIAQGLKSPVLAIFGDIATLHDLNSLAMVKKSKYPVICLIINNGGGGVFSFLPIAKKTSHFEEFFATAHDFEFENAAKFFNIPYVTTTLKEELLSCIRNPISQIIEIKTNRQENFALHEEINNLCQSMLTIGV